LRKKTNGHEWVLRMRSRRQSVRRLDQGSPLLNEEGWTRHQEKFREASFDGADGVVAHAETLLVSDCPVRAFGADPLLTRRGLRLSKHRVPIHSHLWYNSTTWAAYSGGGYLLLASFLLSFLFCSTFAAHAQTSATFTYAPSTGTFRAAAPYASTGPRQNPYGSGEWGLIAFPVLALPDGRVRAHEIETDHTGNFMPVSATVTVSR